MAEGKKHEKREKGKERAEAVARPSKEQPRKVADFPVGYVVRPTDKKEGGLIMG
jgi:hypothetical protein